MTRGSDAEIALGGLFELANCNASHIRNDSIDVNDFIDGNGCTLVFVSEIPKYPYELSSRSEGSTVRRQMQIPRTARDDSHKAPARSFAPLDSRGRLSLRKTFQHGCHF